MENMYRWVIAVWSLRPQMGQLGQSQKKSEINQKILFGQILKEFAPCHSSRITYKNISRVYR